MVPNRPYIHGPLESDPVLLESGTNQAEMVAHVGRMQAPSSKVEPPSPSLIKPKSITIAVTFNHLRPVPTFSSPIHLFD